MEALNNILHTLQPYAIAVLFLITYIAEHLIPQRKETIDHKHDIKNIAVGVFNLAFVAQGINFRK
ncbi:MAG: hypothetical protein WKF85_02425 [Chitinophagaceae bacterium]